MNNQKYSLQKSILQMYRQMPEMLQINPKKNAGFPEMIASLGTAYGAYILGLMSAEEAFEIYDVQKQMERRRLNSVIDQTVRTQQMNAQNLKALKQFKKSLQSNKPVTIDDLVDLVILPVSPEKIENCSPALHDVITEMQEINNSASPGLYDEILKKLKSKYEVPLQQFVDLSTLISARYQNQLLFLPDHLNEETKYQKNINILNYFHCVTVLNLSPKQLKKINQLWFQAAYTLCTRLVDDIDRLSQNDENKSMIQNHCRELKQMLPAPLQKQAFQTLMQELTGLMRQQIVENTPLLLNGFDAYFQSNGTNLTLNADQKAPEQIKQPKSDTHGTSKAPVRQVWQKLINAYDMENFSNPNAAFSVFHDYEILFFMGVLNKEEYDLCEKYHQKTKTILVKKVEPADEEMNPLQDQNFNIIFNLCFANEEMNQPLQEQNGDEASEINDYADDDNNENDEEANDFGDEMNQLLQEMLNKADVNAANDFGDDDDENDEEAEYVPETVYEDRTMPEIFEAVLDAPETNYYALPLKKEYLAAANQLRLAGTVAYHLCDADAQLMPVSENAEPYASYATHQEVEGHFLKGLISVAKKLENNQRIMKNLTLLSDSYWTESVLQLSQLPAYPGRPDISRRVKESIKRLNNLPKNKLSDFSKRRSVYMQTIFEIGNALAEKMFQKDNKIKCIEGNKAWYRFKEYTKVFEEKYLKISNKENINILLKHILKKRERV